MIINGQKRCSKCKIYFDVSKFSHSKHRDGRASQCKECQKIHYKIYRDNNKQKLSEYHKKWRDKDKDHSKALARKSYYKNRDKRLVWEKIQRDTMKAKTFEAYGSECKCCGEKNKEFLCIDHLFGGGYQDRKNNGRSIHHRLMKEGYPKDKYQVLCNNCNMSLGFFGYCPHHPEIKRPVLTGRPKKDVNLSHTSF